MWIVTFLELSHEVEYLNNLCHFRELMGHIALGTGGYIRGTQSDAVKRAGHEE